LKAVKTISPFGHSKPQAVLEAVSKQNVLWTRKNMYLKLVISSRLIYLKEFIHQFIKWKTATWNIVSKTMIDLQLAWSGLGLGLFAAK